MYERAFVCYARRFSSHFWQNRNKAANLKNKNKNRLKYEKIRNEKSHSSEDLWTLCSHKMVCILQLLLIS